MSNTLTVALLDKEYTLSCPAGAEAGLIAAAENLNEKMREISSSGKLLGMERIAVMAALNLSYDNLNSSKAEASSNDESKQLIDKIDATLAKFS
ncbi:MULTISPECIES: cell division protein ZapA [unclassified Marinobacterium]|jgi:cell division protein ZapA|uniref:cell division protein ZapA n=1 Tax=unclassified Marinobacterium TaxID=2644139 RepID=UPI001569CAF4|nr:MULTISPECIES: cell division protein ZapA [unclassified Marinobacterium]NRP10730.1 Cell division protein ZapA [Marinobacterium sp. xm-g-48]NRP27204.1 Cell division protein ZapA [Marinobacterium sp. xm-d-420]NRP46849.1 Cell division protein ZapA [Marinobacterium sp. xm-d-543]NRP52612.1 Cell division protein ZapA [Marinobacterium sp. xm-v-242]NRP77193.1 Cell division protein ZapA [Marinobacterium sp. xm-m-383]